jgi:hypothetical protein
MILLLAFLLAIALTIWFIIFSEAARWAKAIVGLLFAVSMLLRYSRFSMAGFFLQIALSIFIALYLKVQAG